MLGETMPRGKERSEQMREESRTRILLAARKIFAEQGFFNCRVSQIAHEAGMSQGNVYWYFKSKEDILKTILAEGFNAQERITKAVARSDASPIKRFSLLLDSSLEFYRQQEKFMSILLALLAHGNISLLQELGFDMIKIGEQFHRNLIPFFHTLREEDLVAELDPHTLVMFYYAFLNGLVITYGQEWKALPKTILQQAVLRLMGSPAEPVLSPQDGKPASVSHVKMKYTIGGGKDVDQDANLV